MRISLEVMAGPVLLAGAGVALAGWTWRAWVDPLMDFGVQLYVPWRITLGQTLHTDLGYITGGPLSQYFNAALFRLFGVGMMTLAWSNLFIIAATTALIYILMTRMSGRLVAGLAGMTFLGLFAFGQYAQIGSYNWVTPYSHELTHGVVLALGVVLCLGEFLRGRRRLGWLIACGALSGLAFLTKAEVFLGVGAAVAVGGSLALAQSPGRRGAIIAALLGPMLAIPILAWGLLVTRMPAGEAMICTLGSWRLLADEAIRSLPLYQRVFGVDDFYGNVILMVKTAAIYALLLGMAAGAGLAIRSRWVSAALSPILLLAVAGVGLWMGDWIRWPSVARPLPLVVIIAGAVQVLHLGRRVEPEQRHAVQLRLLLAVLALGLLAKTILNVQVQGFGFALTMPAMLVAIEAMVGQLPRSVERQGGSAAAALAVMLGAWGVMLGAHLSATGRLLEHKGEVIASGADAFLADERAAPINLALDAIAVRVAPDQTLLGVPHGAMLNYLSRRASPIREFNVQLPEILAAGGESVVLDELRQSPPDYILVTTWSMAINNRQLLFGGESRYGNDLVAWIRVNYRSVVSVRGALGLVLARRIPSGPEAPVGAGS